MTELLQNVAKLSLAEKLEFQQAIEQLITEERHSTYYHPANRFNLAKGANYRSTDDLKILHIDRD